MSTTVVKILSFVTFTFQSGHILIDYTDESFSSEDFFTFQSGHILIIFKLLGEIPLFCFTFQSGHILIVYKIVQGLII